MIIMSLFRLLLFISLFGFLYSIIIYPGGVTSTPEKGQVGTWVPSWCKYRKTSHFFNDWLLISSGRCKEICARDPDCSAIVCSPIVDAYKVTAIYGKDNAVLDFTNGRRSFCKLQAITREFKQKSKLSFSDCPLRNVALNKITDQSTQYRKYIKKS